VGLDHRFSVTIEGHVGYYAAGQEPAGPFRIDGNAGPASPDMSLADVWLRRGDSRMAAGSTGCGGLSVIEGNAARVAASPESH